MNGCRTVGAVCIPEHTKVVGASLPHARIISVLFFKICVTSGAVWSHRQLLSHSRPPIQNSPTFSLSFYITLFRLLAGICPLKPKLMGRRGQRNGFHKTVPFSANPRIAQERKLAVEGTRVGCVMSYITGERRGAVGSHSFTGSGGPLSCA